MVLDLVEVPPGTKKVLAFLNGVVMVFTQEVFAEEEDEGVAIFSLKKPKKIV